MSGGAGLSLCLVHSVPSTYVVNVYHDSMCGINVRAFNVCDQPASFNVCHQRVEEGRGGGREDLEEKHFRDEEGLIEKLIVNVLLQVVYRICHPPCVCVCVCMFQWTLGDVCTMCVHVCGHTMMCVHRSLHV